MTPNIFNFTIQQFSILTEMLQSQMKRNLKKKYEAHLFSQFLV